MGGNDIGFADKLEACILSKKTCNFAKSDWRGKLKSEIKNQYDDLKNFYEDLKRASGYKAKIYVIGYPQFISTKQDGSCKNLWMLQLNEIEMINNSTVYLNLVIKQAANASGIKYIDIENAFRDNKICDSNNIYVNEIAFRYPSDFLHQGLTETVLSIGNELQESFHPNHRGHWEMAETIKKQLNYKNLLDYQTCSDGKIYCPNSSLNKDNIPDIPYFANVIADGDKFINYKSSSGEFVKEKRYKVTIEEWAANMLHPLVDVKATLHSDPIELTSFKIDTCGDITKEIQIPNNIPVGYHTLIISGKDQDGKDVELYQTILIKGQNEADIDENGVDDSEQACGPFIEASGEDKDYDGIDDACDPNVTDPIIYIARNGYEDRGEDPNKIYLMRNARTAEITGINDFVEKGKFTDNAEAIVAESEADEGVTVKLVNVDDNQGRKQPIVLARDKDDKCFALKYDNYLDPALNPAIQSYTIRKLTKTNIPEGENCE